jgi:hypothetical protein
MKLQISNIKLSVNLCKNILAIIIYIYITLLKCTVLNGQPKLNIPPKLFNTFNTRVSLSVGGDLSYVGKNNEVPLIIVNNKINDNLAFRETTNWSLNLGMDIYSPTSLINFLIVAELNAQKYSIEDTPNRRVDSISNLNIEVPIYLKFRIGKTTGRSHLWIAAGGGYSFPISTKFNSYLDNDPIFDDKVKIDLFKPIPYLSSIIGYEVYLRPGNTSYSSSFRTLIYIKANYDLANRIDPEFIPLNESAIAEIDKLDIQFLRISLGLRFLLF